MHGTTVKRKK